MKKILYAVFTVLCGAAFAAETQQMVSYYPTPRGVYNRITANEVNIGTVPSAEPATEPAPLLEATKFNISNIDVGLKLNIDGFGGKKIQTEKLQLLTLGDPAPGSGKLWAHLLPDAGSVRLKTRLSGAASVKAANETHLINTMAVGNSSFPYSQPAVKSLYLPNTQTVKMSWKPLTFCLNPDDDCPPATRQKATFLVLDSFGITTHYYGWAVNPAVPYALDQNGDSCPRQNNNTAFTCASGDKIESCTDVALIYNSNGVPVTELANSEITYTYSEEPVDVLVNRNQMPPFLPDYPSSNCGAYSQNCAARLRYGSPDSYLQSRDWTQNAATYNVSYPQNLGCSVWSFEFYRKGGSLNPLTAQYRTIRFEVIDPETKEKTYEYRSVQWSEGRYSGWRNAAHLGSQLTDNWPANDPNSNFSDVRHIPGCGNDIQAFCKSNFDGAKCVIKGTFTVQSTGIADRRYWEKIENPNNYNDTDYATSWRCTDQSGTATIATCQIYVKGNPLSSYRVASRKVSCNE